MADLTTLAAVKAWLGISSDVTTNDALLARLITSASQRIQTIINRTILSDDYEEVRDGTGGVLLVTREYPITEVSAVDVDGVAVGQGNALLPGFYHNNVAVILNGRQFTKGYGNVRISYTAGYESIPSDLEQACIEIVAYAFKGRDRIGLSSKGLAGETTSYLTSEIPDSARAVINRYMRVVPV